jgi:hypothetical protein
MTSARVRRTAAAATALNGASCCSTAFVDRADHDLGVGRDLSRHSPNDFRGIPRA